MGGSPGEGPGKPFPSILAEIPRMKDPGGLQLSMESESEVTERA